jgi:hypothetical protein
LEDLSPVSEAADMDVEIIDGKKKAAGIDPSQVENILSWYALDVTANGGYSGLTMSVMDFDSLSAAQAHYDLVTADGLLPMDTVFGDRSAGAEINGGGFGSMLVFMHGNTLISLHTTMGNSQPPLVTQPNLEEMAKLISGRLRRIN